MHTAVDSTEVITMPEVTLLSINKEKEYGILSIVYCEFDEHIDWKALEKTSLKDTPILSRADIYPHLKKLEKEVTLYRKIKSKKSSLVDILDAEEELKDILYQPDYNIDAEFGCNRIRPSYKIFKLEGDITELRLAFKYYGDVRSDIAYNAGYDAGYDAKL